jgi:hypothetical protein
MLQTRNLILAVLSSVAVIVSTSACNKEARVIVADVDGQSVYTSDLEKSAGKALSEQRERLYQLQKQKLEEYVNAVLLTREAKKSGVPVEALLDREVHSKIMSTTDDEIEVFYRSNKSRLGMDLKEAREQIREYLRFRKIETQKVLYLKSLRSNSRIETYLKPPPLFRADVPIAGSPFKGPEHAPVTSSSSRIINVRFVSRFNRYLANCFHDTTVRSGWCTRTFLWRLFIRWPVQPRKRRDVRTNRINSRPIMTNSTRSRLN